MTAFHPSRRSLLKTGAAALAASILPARFALAQSPVVIGAIYVGPRDDYGWNQSHAAAMDILRGVEGVTVIEEENVAETNAVSQTMESMINLEGANLILATSFGYYNPFVIDAAKKYPAVQFRHCAPPVEQGHGSAERRVVFQLSQSGALRERRRGGPVLAQRQAGVCCGQAGPDGAVELQFLPFGRAVGQSECHGAGDFHR